MSKPVDSPNNRSIELCKRVVTTESFIVEAKEIYGERYDYSKVEYKNREHRVTITCPIHGDFQVYAREHLVQMRMFRNGIINNSFHYIIYL